MALLDAIQKLGLSEKEARVYLTSLELGEATIQQISRKAGVSRPSTYLQINSLLEKGLMSSTPRGKKRVFSAEPPEQLKELIKIREKEIQEKETDLKSVLPELKKIFVLSKERPQVRFYEGPEGIKAKREEVFRSKEKFIRNIVPLDELFQFSPQHSTEVTPKRVEKGIRSRVIYTYSRGALPRANDPKLLREMRLVPREKFPFSGDVAISGDTISMSSLKGKYIGVLIKSREIADTLKALFDLAWETAEKYDQVAGGKNVSGH